MTINTELASVLGRANVLSPVTLTLFVSRWSTHIYIRCYRTKTQ